MSDLASSCTISTIDLVGSSAGGRDRQERLDRTREAALDQALPACGIREEEYYRRPDGDSTTLVFRATVPKATIVADFVRELSIALRKLNTPANDAHVARVRVAIDSGETRVTPPHISGDAVTRAARLRDAQPLRDAMAANPEVELGLIVSDRFFDQVIRHGERGLDPTVFTEAWVEVKNFAERGWVYLPQTSRRHANRADRTPPVAPSASPPNLVQNAKVITNNKLVQATHAVFGTVNQSAED